jgi:hypothetical protein
MAHAAIRRILIAALSSEAMHAACIVRRLFWMAGGADLLRDALPMRISFVVFVARITGQRCVGTLGELLALVMA